MREGGLPTGLLGGSEWKVQKVQDIGSHWHWLSLRLGIAACRDDDGDEGGTTTGAEERPERPLAETPGGARGGAMRSETRAGARRQTAARPGAAQTAENSSLTWVSRIELPEGSRKPESIP